MKFAIILSGCGQHDGSETHEVILTLLSLAQEGIDWDAYAPNINGKVVNHITNNETTETRNVLIESARLVRGKVRDIREADASKYNGVIIPGGFGSVSNLCNWGLAGQKFSLNPDFHAFMESTISLKKPVGFICIAPIMIPALYKNACLTIGNDQTLAQQITEMGGNHIICSAENIVIDKDNKVVSTPANMVANGIHEVYQGIYKLIKEIKAFASH